MNKIEAPFSKDLVKKLYEKIIEIYSNNNN